MPGKCPGRMAPRELDSVEVQCPSCDQTLEFFTDEPKRRCKCGRLVLRESLPRCAEWCSAAAQCFGEAMDVRVLKERLKQVKNDPKAKECMERIKKLLEGKKANETKE